MQTYERKIQSWIDSIPDYSTVEHAYAVHAEIKANIAKLRREIERTDEESIEGLKPRSNEARITRQRATATLRDTMAELEAALAESESRIKLLEYQKTMFSTASFIKRTKDTI